jgi:hypothetical protein
MTDIKEVAKKIFQQAYKDDRKFGRENEVNLKGRLSGFFKTELKELNRYNPFDFEGDNILIELKSRRGSLNQFETTIVGYNKIEHASRKNKDCYFVFNFPEGVYYWKYEKELIGGEVRIGKCGRFDRGRAEVKDYAFIPVKLLNPLL